MSLLRTTFASFALAAGSVALAETPKPVFEHQEIDKIQIGYGLAIGDVDGDKKTDILLADAKQIVWYANPGTPGKPGEPWKKHVIAEKITPLDNVCIAARDIDGDGKVEIAVGAMWNPGETNDDTKSGAVFYLIRPADPTQKWEPVKLHHEVTTHRMRWLMTAPGKYVLVVVPLHGKGNKNGAGDGVKVLAYERPANVKDQWKTTLIADAMHMMHNFDFIAEGGDASKPEIVLLSGKEGMATAFWDGEAWSGKLMPFNDKSEGVGEVRVAVLKERMIIAAVEPMHGNKLVTYIGGLKRTDPIARTVLDDTLKEGHALACTDVLGLGRPQIVVGWRTPNKDVKVGVKMFIPTDEACTKWEQHLIDDNKMAAEDLAVADLDGDGKPEIIAAGRSTKNVKIYWNKTGK